MSYIQPWREILQDVLIQNFSVVYWHVILAADHSSLVDCFLPDIVAIQSCSYAYDTQFRISLEFETYISACRLATNNSVIIAAIDDAQ